MAFDKTFITRAKIFWEDVERLEPITIIENGSPNKAYDHSLEQLILNYYVKDWENEENINDLFHWGTMKIFNQVTDKELWIEAVSDVMQTIEYEENNVKELEDKSVVTYEEFRKKVDSTKDLYVHDDEITRTIEVWYRGGYTALMKVSKKFKSVMVVNRINFESLEFDVLDLAIKLAKTPLEDRGE